MLRPGLALLSITSVALLGAGATLLAGKPHRYQDPPDGSGGNVTPPSGCADGGVGGSTLEHFYCCPCLAFIGKTSNAASVRRMASPLRSTIVLLASAALSACAAQSEAPSAAEGTPSVVSTSEALSRGRRPGPLHLHLQCGAGAHYADLTTLKAPAAFDDCAATSMSSSIAIFFLVANAQAQSLLADVNDCVSRVHAADVCAQLLSTEHDGVECSPAELSDDPVGGFSGHDPPASETCFFAELQATEALAALSDARDACVALLGNARELIHQRCPNEPTPAENDQHADKLAAFAALQAAGVADGPATCKPNRACTPRL